MNLMNKDDAWNLIDMLISYFDNLSDVNDGDYGEPKPNKEMQFASACKELLEFVERLP